MKNLYTFLTVVFVIFIANSQVVNIPDTNFKINLLAANNSQDVASTGSPVYNASTYLWSMSTNYAAIDTNQDGQIQVAEAQAVKCLKLTGYNIHNLTGIEAFVNLEYLDCNNNALSTLNVAGLPNLKYLNCVGNGLTGLNIAGLSNLKYLTCVFNELTSLNLSGLTSLQEINCSDNNLSAINVSGLSSLRYFAGANNHFTSLNFTGLPNLQSIDCTNNQLTSINVSGLTNLTGLYCPYNQLSSIDVSGLTNLKTLYCYFNQLSTLDVGGNGLMDSLICNDNQLSTLFIKNNYVPNWTLLDFTNNPSLVYICTDESDITTVQTKVNAAGYAATCQVNSYCNFNPGGTFYTIQGSTHFDSNGNGCDNNDIIVPNLRIAATNGSVSGAIVPNSTGNYVIPVSTGTHTITPVLEHPAYFTVSPASATIAFPTSTSPYNQSFCVTPNGIKNDLEIAIIPLGFARPGFDANYKIIYKNNGNQIANGSISLNFNDDVIDFVSGVPANTGSATNMLNWFFANLNPFEAREIMVTFNINSPTETPAVNSGDILVYNVAVAGASDETPNDNTAALNQDVVNSYDPNDKICVEGTTILPQEVGGYVHYVIRFENTGTFSAENIVVKDIIDTTKFDINTLVPLNGSHDFVTRITNTNRVEFIFENINLPFDDANNDGYVAFKIKTKPTLVVGNSFTNSASIYFDYNFPIITNTATTTVTALGTADFDFGTLFTLSPIPAKDQLNIIRKQDVAISSASIYNMLGQLIQVHTNPNETIDVSDLKPGNYFIRLNTDKGTASSKFIKE